MTNKLWDVMNDLEMVTSKICSAREIIDTAVEAIQQHKYSKAETLMSAAHEFLDYYLDEFDEKFKLAWKETVVKQKEEEEITLYSTHYRGPYRGPSNDFWEGSSSIEDNIEKPKAMSYDEAIAEGWEMTADGFWFKEPDKEDKVIKWSLPVEEQEDGEYYISLPDDLLEAANLKEGEKIEWVDQGNGSYLFKKVN